MRAILGTDGGPLLGPIAPEWGPGRWRQHAEHEILDKDRIAEIMAQYDPSNDGFDQIFYRLPGAEVSTAPRIWEILQDLGYAEYDVEWALAVPSLILS